MNRIALTGILLVCVFAIVVSGKTFTIHGVDIHFLQQEGTDSNWRENTLDEHQKRVLKMCPNCNPGDFCPVGKERDLPDYVLKFVDGFDGSQASMQRVVEIMREMSGTKYHCFFQLVFGDPNRDQNRLMLMTLLMSKKYATPFKIGLNTSNGSCSLTRAYLSEDSDSYIMSKQQLLKMIEELSQLFGCGRGSKRHQSS